MSSYTTLGLYLPQGDSPGHGMVGMPLCLHLRKSLLPEYSNLIFILHENCILKFYWDYTFLIGKQRYFVISKIFTQIFIFMHSYPKSLLGRCHLVKITSFSKILYPLQILPLPTHSDKQRVK